MDGNLDNLTREELVSVAERLRTTLVTLGFCPECGSNIAYTPDGTWECYSNECHKGVDGAV